MTFRVFVITFIACPLITLINANSGGNSGQTPFCALAPLPLQNETSAVEYVQYYHQNCNYNYWKVGSRKTYHGMNGYKKMFGDIGYMFNKSTVWEYDGRPVRGYMNARAKTVVSQNLISITVKPKDDDLQLLAWSSYEVFYKFTAQFTLNVGGVNETVESFVRWTWFNDSSGIVKYSWNNASSNSTFVTVVKNIITTTQAISAHLGYLNDDTVDYTNNYIQNPIQFIFICVFCALTAFVALCVYVVLKFSFSGHKIVK
eukprot:178407_1